MQSRLRAALLGLALAIPALSAGPARAQRDGAFRIGIMEDMTGPGASIGGMHSVLAARMAVEDFGGKISSTPVELVYADHQGKTDLGAGIARKWYEEDGVGAIAEVPYSQVLLAVHELARKDNKVLLASGGASSRITGDLCSPNTVHWFPDGYSIVNATAAGVVALVGPEPWFTITRDDASGTDFTAQIEHYLNAHGTRQIGIVRAPFNTQDFSSYVLQAQGSGAKVIAIANGAADFVNSMKQAAEFGLLKDHTFAGISVTMFDVQGAGLAIAKGLLIANDFYWDRDDDTRAFAQRMAARDNGRLPGNNNAQTYAEVLHYLRALAQVGSDADGAKLVRAMKKLPFHDMAMGSGTIRVDGRVMYPMGLYQVKSPEESKGPYDLLRLVRTVPAEQAFRPLEQSDCPLLPQLRQALDAQ